MGRFDPMTSDLDSLVEFGKGAPRGVGPFLQLTEELEGITGREVDLVGVCVVRDPTSQGAPSWRPLMYSPPEPPARCTLNWSFIESLSFCNWRCSSPPLLGSGVRGSLCSRRS